ncbi:ICP22 family protein [Alkalibacillus haloalkaliphilus]|uniref:Gram-positive cocci surface proteins LPxTG domain-containing protein n=1 Tax=Alkalibacillus haloalkaliphilus TaxID=94136 RepID=A0A511W203_9BACI|nr:hypothetical protein [Alkalibacillus haloalkaliphilus]GEN45084.1 hypothetical protein AHA02nite_08600 [Alkalibacillus haloalkaliphilus]
MIKSKPLKWMIIALSVLCISFSFSIGTFAGNHGDGGQGNTGTVQLTDDAGDEKPGHEPQFDDFKDIYVKGHQLQPGKYYVRVTSPSEKEDLGTSPDAGIVVSDGGDFSGYNLYELLGGYPDETPNQGGVYKLLLSKDDTFTRNVAKSKNFKFDITEEEEEPGNGEEDNGENGDENGSDDEDENGDENGSDEDENGDENGSDNGDDNGNEEDENGQDDDGSEEEDNDNGEDGENGNGSDEDEENGQDDDGNEEDGDQDEDLDNGTDDGDREDGDSSDEEQRDDDDASEEDEKQLPDTSGDGDEADEEQEETTAVASTVDGGELPETSTPWYNLLAISIALLLASGGYLLFKLRPFTTA